MTGSAKPRSCTPSITAEVISSTRNPAVMEAARLHRARHRRETGRTLLEGPSVVFEAIAAGIPILELYVLDGDPVPEGYAATVRIVTAEVLGKLAGTSTPRGPVGVIDIPASVLPTDRPALVAWGVSDPGNCGTIVRTAAAFEYGFVAGPESADPWAPKVLRAGAGGHFRTSVATVGDLVDLGGLRLVGTVARGGALPGPVREGEALLVGSEAHGLPEDVVAACERLVTIPMKGGAESLNAAVAAGIAAYLGTLGDQR